MDENKTLEEKLAEMNSSTFKLPQGDSYLKFLDEGRIESFEDSETHEETNSIFYAMEVFDENGGVLCSEELGKRVRGFKDLRNIASRMKKTAGTCVGKWVRVTRSGEGIKTNYVAIEKTPAFATQAIVPTPQKID